MVVRFLFTVFLLLLTPLAFAYYNNYPKITQMENHLYKQSYESQDIYQRLDRIERSLYKAPQSNKSLSERVDNIANQLHISGMPGYLLNDIAYLEKINFNKTFGNDSPDARLERLEYHLAGSLLEGNYTDRVFKLKTLSNKNNINNYFDTQNTYAYGDKYIDDQEEEVKTSKWAKVQETLMFVAPILLGIL